MRHILKKLVPDSIAGEGFAGILNGRMRPETLDRAGNQTRIRDWRDRRASVQPARQFRRGRVHQGWQAPSDHRRRRGDGQRRVVVSVHRRRPARAVSRGVHRLRPGAGAGGQRRAPAMAVHVRDGHHGGELPGSDRVLVQPPPVDGRGRLPAAAAPRSADDPDLLYSVRPPRPSDQRAGGGGTERADGDQLPRLRAADSRADGPAVRARRIRSARRHRGRDSQSLGPRVRLPGARLLLRPKWPDRRARRAAAARWPRGVRQRGAERTPELAGGDRRRANGRSSNCSVREGG